MRRLRAFWIRLTHLLGARTSAPGLDAELESHLELHIDDNLRAGMPPAEARRRALIDLGGFEQTRQALRERSTLPWIENLAQDLKFALRQLGKSPGFTAVVIVTLALGIGLNTALFSIVNTVLLHPIALPRPNELVDVNAAKPNFPYGSVSWPNFRDWQRDNHTLAALAMYRHKGFVLTGAGESERLHGDYVTSDFFPLLGVKPVLGRLFAPGEDEIGRGPVVLISEQLWARKFGSSPDVLGRTIQLDGGNLTIVGVIPASFDMRFRSFNSGDVYIPMGAWDTKALIDRGAGLGIRGVARLKPGVTLAQAQADLAAISDHLAAEFPQDDHDVRASLTPLRAAVVGDVQPVLLVLLGAVGCVLLIACVNVANLLLARSNARSQEFAVRLALGASRTRIIRQLLTESLLLALAGGAAGLLLAAWGTRAAVRIAPSTLPRAVDIHLSPLVLAFTFAVSCIVGVVFGLFPAMRVAAQSPQTTLREGGRGAIGVRHRAQDWLVIFEMAAALVLLAGAGLMIRSLVALSQTNPGFESKGVLDFSLSVPDSPATNNPQGARSYLEQVDRQIQSVPGVHSVSFALSSVPMTGDDDEQYFWLPGEARPASEMDAHWSLLYIVEPDYLNVMNIPLLRGRFFTDADREGTPRVAVIDTNLAHKYFGDADPIGKTINFLDDPPVTVIGEVGHIMQWELDNDAAFPLRAQFYLPMGQLNGWQLVSTTGFTSDILVRADHPGTVFPDIASALRRMNHEQVPYGPKTMDAIIADTLIARRFTMILLGAFAALALLLASVGLYGVISYLVGQRTQEMAIRMALGADRGRVLLWVLQRGSRLAALGACAGLFAALIVTQLMAHASLAQTAMLYGVRAWDPVTMGGVVLVLMVVALAACYIPARRAASVDPMQALRSE
jgi:predicted permease